jgi:hypothetical protein
MASRILAIQANRPRIDFEKTLQTDQLVEYMATRTGLNTGEVLLVAYELHDALENFLRSGRPVKLDGVGTFSPDLRSDGTFIVHYRPDAGLKRKLNARDAFRGKLLNRKNVGRSAAELVAQWNADHPDDPVKP